MVLVFILVKVDGCSAYFWHQSFMGLLNNIVTGLGSPGPSGVNLICNKAKFTSALLSKLFLNSALHLYMLLLVHFFGDGMMKLLA